MFAIFFRQEKVAKKTSSIASNGSLPYGAKYSLCNFNATATKKAEVLRIDYI